MSRPRSDSESSLFKHPESRGHFTVVVFGASGDLARRKVLPSLFSLYHKGLLDPLTGLTVIGYGRSDLSTEEFHNSLKHEFQINCKNFEDHHIEAGDCFNLLERFLDKCVFIKGQYDNKQDFSRLSDYISEVEAEYIDAKVPCSRVFYLSIPPSIFLPVAELVHTHCRAVDGRTLLVVEKPFGRDLESAIQLERALKSMYSEPELFRIDHFNSNPRFSNVIFEPIWNSHYIESVEISFLEKAIVSGRGGYYSQMGVIRDIFQNHLLNVLSFVAMDQPYSLDADAIRDECVKLLKQIKTLDMSNIITGQYLGFHDDPTIPPDCKVPTYCAAVLEVNNRRWDGVPFFVRMGKALHKNASYIKIRFKEVPGNLFRHKPWQDNSHNRENHLFLSIQPEAGLKLGITGKVPGFGTTLNNLNLNMFYHSMGIRTLPDAYESVLLSMLSFDQSLFLRHDQIYESWRIINDVIHQLDNEPQEFNYQIGSEGPLEASDFVGKWDFRWCM
ncbi:hypothetical protein P9112_012974 [Eukaryota sp. TZLM1-RC]